MLSWSFVCVKCWDDSEGCSYGQQVIGSSITTTWLLVHHVSCRVFWLNIWSPRWLRPPQPWFGALPLVDFPKTEIFWNGKDFRPSERFTKIWQGSWRLLGELCEGPRSLLEGDWAALSLLWSNDSYTLCLQCDFKWNFVHWPFQRSSMSPAILP